MPLIRRLPKRGFNNAAFHSTYAVVNLDDLNTFKAGTLVNEELLRESRLVRGNIAGVKILGNGELKHSLTIEADRISVSARDKIEKAGGSFVLRQASSRQPEPSPTESQMEVAPARKPKSKRPAKRTATSKGKSTQKKGSARGRSKKESVSESSR